MTFTVYNPFFDIQNESTSRLQDTLKLQSFRQKPLNVLIRINAPVSLLSLIGVWWRGKNQVNRIIGCFLQDFLAIAK
jgi:hypothetical protein